MKAQLPAGDLLRLFSALPPEVERLCLFSGLAGQGFEDTLAWDPVAVLEGASNLDAELPRELACFVQEQSARGRLVLGFCSYELGQQLHGLPQGRKPGPGTPDYCWLAYESWLTRQADVWCVEYAAEGRFLRQLEAARRLAREPAPEARRFAPLQFQPLLAAQDYRRAYERVAEYIRAGEIYQVNLTYPLRAQTELADRELFPFVARSNPVQHLAYLEAPGYSIQSASPERFVRFCEREIETLPIKGTRPRAAPPEQDQARLAELLASAKEAAELNMITDLLRNDLARVCVPGSVQVAEHRVPRAGPTVWHTASRVVGSLQSGVAPFEAMLSMLPGGSISGCPKRRALQIIDELEPFARGIYTGVIGRLPPDGTGDFSVAIRTLLKQGRDLTLSVGGGIVYDSDPEQELAETRLKASSFEQLPARFEARASGR